MSKDRNRNRNRSYGSFKRVEKSRPKTREIFKSDKIIKLKISITVNKDSYLYIAPGNEQILPIETDWENLDPRDLSSKICVEYSHITIDEIPVIPGSSLKGAVRHTLEQSLPYIPVCKACYIVQTTRRPISRNRYNYNFVNIYGINNNPPPERENCNPPYNVCMICDLFGSGRLSSRVMFSNLYLRSDMDLKPIKVSMGRRNIELYVVQGGSVFTGDITIYNASDRDIALILSGLGILDNKEIVLGQKKYTKVRVDNNYVKFGRVKVKLESISEIKIDKNTMQIIENPIGIERIKDESRDIIKKEFDGGFMIKMP
ncbi:MAG: RAMP superfamily CRISPR-associated protein [Candidatus Helarchaeota archaeon]